MRRLRQRPARAVLLAEDETTLRLLPPLRAAWAPRGQQATVPISGENAQRVLFGALNVATGHRLILRRPRSCAAAFQAFLSTLRANHYRAGPPNWLLIDKATCPTDHLWRHLKKDLAANRQRADIDALAAQAKAWVLDLSADDTLRKAGLLSKNCWLKKVRTNLCPST